MDPNELVVRVCVSAGCGLFVLAVGLVAYAFFGCDAVAEGEEDVARKRRPPCDPPVTDPESDGEKYRGVMSESIECNLSLVWWWVKNRHGIDLADRNQATALQVYRLVLPIVELGDVFLTAEILHEEIDKRMGLVFGPLK